MAVRTIILKAKKKNQTIFFQFLCNIFYLSTSRNEIHQLWYPYHFVLLKISNDTDIPFDMWIVDIVRIPGTCWKAWIVACKKKKEKKLLLDFVELIQKGFMVHSSYENHVGTCIFLAFSLPSMVLFRITGKKYTCFTTFLNSLIQIVK